MRNWSYADAVKKRLDDIAQERRLHRVVSVDGGDLNRRARCGCGMEEALWQVKMHLETLEMEWVLPVGVDVR